VVRFDGLSLGKRQGLSRTLNQPLSRLGQGLLLYSSTILPRMVLSVFFS
jgi:hypothetical protein